MGRITPFSLFITVEGEVQRKATTWRLKQIWSVMSLPQHEQRWCWPKLPSNNSLHLRERQTQSEIHKKKDGRKETYEGYRKRLNDKHLCDVSKYSCMEAHLSSGCFSFLLTPDAEFMLTEIQTQKVELMSQSLYYGNGLPSWHLIDVYLKSHFWFQLLNINYVNKGFDKYKYFWRDLVPWPHSVLFKATY